MTAPDETAARLRELAEVIARRILSCCSGRELADAIAESMLAFPKVTDNVRMLASSHALPPVTDPPPPEALTPEEWQSIETAPKDGSDLLLLFPFGITSDPTCQSIAVGRWSDHSQQWWLTCIWAGSLAHHAPTHWMPLRRLRPVVDTEGK